MLYSLTQSFKAIFDSYLWKITLLCALTCCAIFALFLGIIAYFLFSNDLSSGWFIDKFIDWFGTASAVFLSYFLFPIVFPIIAQFFIDPVANHIEGLYYPENTEEKRQDLLKTLPGTVWFVLISLFLNLLVLPLYLIPGLNIFVYYMLNGYLFGREYFEMVALRIIL